MTVDFVAPADSARVIAAAYNTSLLLIVPLLVVALALAGPGRDRARSVDALVWRGALLAMAVLTVLAASPAAWHAWVLPAPLALPLLSLGSAELGATGATVPTLDRLLLAWCAGSALVLVWRALANIQLRRQLGDATPCRDAGWQHAATVAVQRVPLSRPVPLVRSAAVRVPMVVGLRRPRIVLPMTTGPLSHEERVAILVHERAHLAHGDLHWSFLARVLSALWWFHPAVRIASSHFHRAAEGAADERVLAAGIRASTYATLLGLRRWHPRGGTLTLAGGNLRDRLAHIVAGRVSAVPPPQLGRRVQRLAIALSLPLGLLQLAPQRTVLDALMRADRWESRAFAVSRLAQRADSVGVAQAAAVRDPNPRVRAAARAALARAGRPLLPLVS